ncbi:MAG: glycosyl transferase family 36, partial [Syntrophomonadaceae bacterium]|nr:glycosyl transferase family 36 [Syntrophomonadaceae bacterium]
MALINHLCRVMEYVQQQRDACELAEKILSSLDMAKLDAETLRNALDEAGQEIPLSGSLIVHLTRQLREWADDSHTVREWLMCKLDNGTESFDSIVSYEFQLQATYQVTTGNIITSLRNISRWDWQNQFEQICMVEQALREESTGIYSLLDFPSRDQLRQKVEELAYRFKVPETLVAKQAVMLANNEREQILHVRQQQDQSNSSHNEELPRQTFVAFYLLESKGIKELRNALKICGTPSRLPKMTMPANATGSYFFVLTLFLLAVIRLFTEWIGPAGALTISQWVLAIIALLLPASEWAVIVTHWLIEILKRPQPLLKYDFSRGIPPEATTMVVIPVIWSSIKEIQTLVSRLELHYLANRNENIFFGLLVDLTDSNEEIPENDALLIDAARNSIEDLNSMYSRPGGSIFYLFQRHRSWNQLEGIWMGWERKRGALVEFVELLKGKSDNTCQFVVGENDILPKIRYVITLDADTQLPMETARRMIGAIHLPYNRPRLNKSRTRVVEGYGILQPSISISHNSAMRSRFASLYSADSGIDPYSFAVSDPYQDAFRQGIFAGKGIFDVDSFANVLCERIPDNRVLSHDLLEGGFLRAGLLSDIELIDEYPSKFASYQKRMHRWVRGDWQLLPLIFKMVPDRRDNLLPVDLSPLTRWQMIDNLRHSLLLPVLFVLLLLGITVLPGPSERWFTIILATLSLPVIRQLIMVRSVILRPRGLLAVVGQLIVTIVTWPFQVILLLDAICRTLYRLFISKRHLLEWVSAA